jgi:K+-transporting ATPase c subunit
MFKKLLKALRQASLTYLLLGFLYSLVITVFLKPSFNMQTRILVSTYVLTVTFLVLALESVLSKEEVETEHGGRPESF